MCDVLTKKMCALLYMGHILKLFEFKSGGEGYHF